MTVRAAAAGAGPASRTGAGLLRQYLVALAAVVSLAVAALGAWMNDQVTIRVLDATAETAAGYLQSLIHPHVQGLARSGTLSAADRAAPSGIIDSAAQGGHFVVVKIWSPDGRLLFPAGAVADPPPAAALAAVRAGHVTGNLPDLADAGHADERALGSRLYEIYMPLRDDRDGRVIAVGEVYQNADYIAAALFDAATDNWAVFVLVGSGVVLVLGGIVLRASRIIDRQAGDLRARIDLQEALLRQNAGLRRRAEHAARTVAQLDELAQKRLGADLHDGAGQLLGFLLMRMDQLERAVQAPPAEGAGTKDADSRLAKIVTDMRDAATEALREVRGIAFGLVAPHLEQARTLQDHLAAVAREHGRLTGTEVALDLASDLPEVSDHVRRTVGRIAQEALSNAFKHAGGQGQRVSLDRGGPGRLALVISNQTPAIPPHALPHIPPRGSPGAAPDPAPDSVQAAATGRLGLTGMVFRAESLGGSLTVSSVGALTVVHCLFPDSA